MMCCVSSLGHWSLSRCVCGQVQVEAPPTPQHAPEAESVCSVCVLCLPVPPVIVKEWSSGKAKSALTPELVPALCFREWTCPNLRRLWLGRASEDRSRRTRAFLACLRSDCPALLNPAQVPQHLLLMCCVLRYDMGLLHVGAGSSSVCHGLY